MSDKNFVNKYLQDFSVLIKPNEEEINKIVTTKDILLDVKKNSSKVMIFGNGGSSAIASHFSVDLTKTANIRSVNYNEADLITCFANDFGYERWVEKAIDFYSDEKDVLILISSSGESKNMLNGAKAARNANFKSIVTLSGFAKDNRLSQLGDINLWMDSKAYNFVESVHQIWLLTVVDLIVGSREYSA